MPITNDDNLVKGMLSNFLEIIRFAFRIARSGRQGPVLIDIPVII